MTATSKEVESAAYAVHDSTWQEAGVNGDRRLRRHQGQGNVHRKCILTLEKL